MCKPEVIIEVIRKSFIGAEQVYTQGSCIMFFRILHTLYPNAEPYWSKEARHMIAKIDNAYYDISGKVKKTPDYELDNGVYTSLPIAVAFPQKAERRVRSANLKKVFE